MGSPGVDECTTRNSLFRGTLVIKGIAPPADVLSESRWTGQARGSAP